MEWDALKRVIICGRRRQDRQIINKPPGREVNQASDIRLGIE